MRGSHQPVSRRVGSTALAVLGSLLLLIGGFFLYAREELFDADAFADRARSALDDEQVRLALSQPIVEAVIDQGPAGLVNARPLLESAVVGALGSAPFEAAFREAAKAAHASLFESDPDALLLDLTDAAIVATEAVAAISPRVAEKIPKTLDPAGIELIQSSLTIDTLSYAREVRILGLLLPILGLLCLAGSVAIAPDRRRALLRASVAIAVISAVGLATLLVARGLVVSQFGDDLVADAARAAWQALFGDLGDWWMVTGTFGIVLAAATSFGRKPVDLLLPARLGAGLLRRQPLTSAARAARAVAVGLVSVGILLRPDLALTVVAIAIGAWGLYFAVSELLGVIAPFGEGTPGPSGAGLRARLRVGRAASLAAVLAALVLGLVLISDGDDSPAVRPAGPVTACNGYAELCDLTLEQLTIPATHNSMSAADLPGWFLPNQRHDMIRQLDDGIRGLLIDTHYGFRRGDGRGFGQVVTDLEREDKTRTEVVAELGEETVVRAEQLVGKLALGGSSEPSEPFLCHVLCELGASELTGELVRIREWLDAHPDEFIVIFIEDVVSPEETAAAFEQSGLLRYAYEHDRDEPFPALRELIESDRRLLVLAENDAGDGRYPWYHQGFDLVQETPFTYANADQLASRSGCRPNRGTSDSPLFQINNWIETIPRDPDLAGQVNSFETLAARAGLCEQVRNLQPNLIAVDYYDRGGLFEVARTLNGVARDAEPAVRMAG